jgi:hypothetical protein
MSDRPDHVSTFALDALTLGALSPEESEKIRTHLSICPRCRTDLEAASAARDHFVREVLPRTQQRFRQLAEPRRLSHRLLPLVLVPALAAATVAMFVLPSIYRESKSDLRIKGGPVLQAVALRGEHTFLVDNKTVLAPGDKVRFVVQPAGFEYVLIASADADGKATVYFPYAGAQSERLEFKGTGEIPGAIVLDAARGPERVFAFFSHDPLPAAPALAELRALGAQGAAAIRAQRTLGVSAGAQASVLFEKVAP